MSKRHPVYHSDGEYRRSASRSSSFKMGKKGTAGNPAPSWKPNLRHDGTYDSRPQKSIRETRPDTFRALAPEIGSRVFISGLPKDITNQDLEDLMTSTIGPVHEVYIVHQYFGTPLYKHSSASARPTRNPQAEFAENIRNVKSTGCGIVHFQRDKDAMEAWEQYHGKLLDNDSTVLRVQVVIDADETWLLPQAEREQNRASTMFDNTSMENQESDWMAIDERIPNTRAKGSIEMHPIPTRTTPNRGHLEDAATPTQTPLPRSSSSMPYSRSMPSKGKPQIQSNAPNKSSNISLVQRIGPSSSDPNARQVAPIPVGEHLIMGTSSAGISSLANRIGPVDGPKDAMSKPANVVVAPRGRIRKGPRRVAKIAARQQARLPGTNPQALGKPLRALDRADDLSGTSRAKVVLLPTRDELDAQMDFYRQGGLMGLSRH